MIRLATVEDAPLIHKIIMSAFEEYKHADVPSGALDETVDFIEKSLRNGSEKALLYYKDEIPVGTIRFTTDINSLYFYRLAVCPEERRKGIAKSMLAWLENYAKEHGKSEIWCRVRLSVPQNILLYQSVGYIIKDKEIVKHPNGSTVKIVIMKKEL